MTTVFPIPTAGDMPDTAAFLTVLPGQRGRRAARPRMEHAGDRLARAIAAAAADGVAAVWTGNHSAAVELARLAGPHEHLLTDAEADHFGLPKKAPRQLALGPVRCAVYERVLCTGSPFAIYRWVDLLELAGIWRALCLPCGVRSEWRRALRAAKLM